MFGKNKKTVTPKPKPIKARHILGGGGPQTAGISGIGSPSSANSAGQKTSLISDAHAAAKVFSELCERYAAATEGYRARVYQFAASCYKIGYGFMSELDEFELFKSDPFWNDVRQKPKDNKIMKAVLIFAMKAKSKQLLNRASKTAFVLESLAAQDLDASEVAEHLKASGGIEKMYRDLSPSRKNNSRIRDDLELLIPAVDDDDADDSDEDLESSEAELFNRNNPFDGRDESGPDADDADGQRNKSPAVPRAASDGFKISDFGGFESPPKRPSLRAIFDPSKHLLIDVSDSGVTVEEALNMGELRIVAIVEPVDDSDYWPAKAVSVTKVSQLAGLRKKLRNEEAED